MMKRLISLVAIVAAFVLSACSGGGGASPTPVLSSGTTPSQHSSSARVTLSVAVPAAPKTLSIRRRPKFVAPNTAGILVNTYAQSDTSHAHLLGSTATDISSGAPACGGQSGTPRTCTIVFDAVSGADTFVISSYDTAPVNNSFSGANQLGAALVNQTISSGSANTVGVALGGIIASITIAIPKPNIHGTLASSQTIEVNGLDADGNVILTDGYVDANGNPTPIQLDFVLNTGNVLSLSTNSLAAPSASGVQLMYNGQATAAFSTALQANAGTIQAVKSMLVMGPVFTAWQTQASSSFPQGITTSPASSDPNLYFTDQSTNSLGVVTPTGTITEYLLVGTQPRNIAPGPDGNLWITDAGSNQIEIVTTTGTHVAAFNPPSANSGLTGITKGSDGNMWFTELSTGNIGYATPAHATVESSLGTGSQPYEIVSGPDGRLWVTDLGKNEVWAIDPTTHIAQSYTLGSPVMNPIGIAVGPDGNLWVAGVTGHIAKVTTSGTVTQYNVPSSNSQPVGITAGADGNMWFSEASGRLGRITMSGVITEYTPNSFSALNFIVSGSDGALWFSGLTSPSNAGGIGRFQW